jgi:hypothetical protein
MLQEIAWYIMLEIGWYMMVEIRHRARCFVGNGWCTWIGHHRFIVNAVANAVIKDLQNADYLLYGETETFEPDKLLGQCTYEKFLS